MNRPQIQIKRLPHADGLDLPGYMTPLSAGLDLPAALENSFVMEPGDVALIPTGFSMAIPPGFEGQVRPRSGLAVKYGLTLINAPGTIDADYRGEVKVAMINLGKEAVTLKRGDRLAQLIIAPVAQAELIETQELPSSRRGEGGFGHTG